MKYNKPPTTFDEQIQLLESRGMKVPDPEKARHYLSHLNYYRIGAYWLPFESDHGTHQFEEATNFDDVLNLYVFDRELRLLVMDAIERVEVSLRTQWAYQLAHTYDSHAYLNKSLFKCQKQYEISISKLMRELSQSHETFIKHYTNTYSEPQSPPLWTVVEVMTLGLLSRVYANLKHRKDRNKIASVYRLDEVVIVSFLHHLSTLRNHCAHHSRLWNRSFTFTFKLPRQGNDILLKSFNGSNRRKIYNTLMMLEYLMEIISPGTHWKSRLVALLESHPVVDTAAMGFPDEWKKLPVWQ